MKMTKKNNEKELEAKLLEATQEIEKLNTENEELKNSAQRALADLQNFRRRNDEEKSSFIKFANNELFLGILPIIDNFERAYSNVPKELQNNEWKKGMEHIHNDFKKLLEEKGVEPIESLGKPFDADLHDAMAQGPGKKDVITEEFEKGYMIGDRVLRHAKVKVGNGEKE